MSAATPALAEAPSYQIPGLGSNTLDYNQFGSYLKDLKKRDAKHEDKKGRKAQSDLEALQAQAASLFNYPKQRGRKPIHIKQ